MSYQDYEEAVRVVGGWLDAQGVVGWTMDIPAAGDPLELRLDWENRAEAERIRRHFGESLLVTISPEDAPRYRP